MLEKLEACYERLQGLAIVPTVSNMEKLLQSLYDIKEVYQELKKGENHDGSEVDIQ